MIPFKPLGATSASNSDDNSLDDLLPAVDDASVGSAGPVASPVFYTAPSAGSLQFASTENAVTTPLAATGPNNVTITGSSGLTIDLDFLTSAQTQGQENLVVSAATTLANDIKISKAVVPSGRVTVTLDVNFSGTGGGADAGPSDSFYYSYASVVTALKNNEPSDPNLAALPANLPSNITNDPNKLIWVANAEAKVLGLEGSNSVAVDGAATFTTDIPDDALIGVALHELTHAMARVPFGSQATGADDAPDVFDLFRFTSAGTIYVDDATPAPQSAYFSIDGGKTVLAYYGQNSDPSDFANSNQGTPTSTLNPNDPFDQYYNAGTTVQGLTQLDLTQLDALGFNTSGATATPCYMRGTQIRTERGDTPVEQLVVGDQVVTASGALKRVVWLGHTQVDIASHAEPSSVRPVRVAAGAFGAGLPYRDLWLSPGHSVACDGALIPIQCLVNGRSVAQIDHPNVEYWHVELEAHDVLIAEGLPAESYLDTGNRAAFDNGAAFADALPHHAMATCLPLVTHGAPVAAVKTKLIARLMDQGYGVVADPDPHIMADGKRIEPIRLAEPRLAFAIPQGSREIALCSKSFVPAETRPESNDTRQLGLCVGWLQIDGDDIALDGDDFASQGWQAAEFSDGRFAHRWTTGSAPLPAGTRLVLLDVVGDGRYWRDPKDNVVAISDWIGRRNGDRGA